MHLVRGAVEAPFELTSMTETPAPAGSDGMWHRYVITQGENTIVGMRAGTRGEVSASLAELVERLNTRFAKALPTPKASGPRGRGAKSSTPVSRA